MGLWGLMGPVGHIFLSSYFVNGLACGYLGEIPGKFKKCIIWIHFPILELKNAIDLPETECAKLMLLISSNLAQNLDVLAPVARTNWNCLT